MTIEFEHLNTGVEAIKTYCADCSNSGRDNGVTLYNVNHGPNRPITEDERGIAELVAEEHDLNHDGLHRIRVIQFHDETEMPYESVHTGEEMQQETERFFARQQLIFEREGVVKYKDEDSYLPDNRHWKPKWAKDNNKKR